MKRIVSLIVSAVMLFAMTATTFADPQMDSTMPMVILHLPRTDPPGAYGSPTPFRIRSTISTLFRNGSNL